MFVGNKKKVMDTLIDECTQKNLQKVATFFMGLPLCLTLKGRGYFTNEKDGGWGHLSRLVVMWRG